MSYFEPVGTNLYGYSQSWVYKNLEALIKFLKLLILFSQIFGQPVVFNFFGTQNMWVFISVDDQILLALKIGGN